MSTEGPSNQGKLVTSRLVLRGARLEDVDALHDCFRDGEVMRYWDTLPHATKDVTLDWVERMIQGPANGVTDFVITLRKDNLGNSLNSTIDPFSEPEVVIGKAGIWQDNEIGFLLNRNYWGKGLGVEALTALVDLAFGLTSLLIDQTVGDVADTETHPEDLVADVDPRNEASLKVLAKLGFEVYATKENTFQVGDTWVDSVYLRLKRRSWEAKMIEIPNSRSGLIRVYSATLADNANFNVLKFAGIQARTITPMNAPNGGLLMMGWTPDVQTVRPGISDSRSLGARRGNYIL